jgi:hypothetical protein
VLEYVVNDEDPSSTLMLTRADLWTLHRALDECDSHGKTKCRFAETIDAVQLVQTGEAAVERETTRKRISSVFTASRGLLSHEGRTRFGQASASTKSEELARTPFRLRPATPQQQGRDDQSPTCRRCASAMSVGGFVYRSVGTACDVAIPFGVRRRARVVRAASAALCGRAGAVRRGAARACAVVRRLTTPTQSHDP